MYSIGCHFCYNRVVYSCHWAIPLLLRYQIMVSHAPCRGRGRREGEGEGRERREGGRGRREGGRGGEEEDKKQSSMPNKL